MIKITTETITTITCDYCNLPIHRNCGMVVVSFGKRNDEMPTNQEPWEPMDKSWPRQYHENCISPLITRGKWGHVNEYGN